MNKCLVCGQEMKLIPAGVSKSTGRPYQAFLACPNKCKQPTYQQATQPKIEPKQDPNWDKISFGKCKYGFLIELIKKDANLEDAEQIAEAWARASMRILGEPKITKFGEAGDGFNLDQIPFN